MNRGKFWGTSSVIITLAGIAINLLGAKLAAIFDWVLFLDTIGTILAAALGGILPGLIAGFVSNAVNSVADPITMYYGLLNMLIGVAAYILVQCGAFRRFWSALLCVIPFSLIGGGMGSLMTWLLYGLDFGSGISAPLAIRLHENLELSKFFAQFAADLGVDLVDKLVTVVLVYLILRYLPEKLLDAAPYGKLFGQRMQRSARWSWRAERRGSLRNKVAMMIVVTAAVLIFLAGLISSVIYNQALNARYVSAGQDACNLALQVLDGDEINGFLAEGEAAENYSLVAEQLQNIRNCMADIEYLYVYQIREDGCHVVFDVDTEDLNGESPGTLVPFDAAFEDNVPALLAGEEIEPVISNEAYGWLLTIYRPLQDSSGSCVAYVAADIAMADVLSDRYIFIIRLISLMLGATMLIVALSVWFSQKKFVEPIDALAASSQRFAFTSEQSRKQNIEEIRALNIHTGDEIENLHKAICKTVSDMSGYIDQIAASNEFISRLQDNIIVSFAEMVENRDENTGCHIKRTAAYVEIIGKELLRQGRYPHVLTSSSLEHYVKSAPLHDIGKIKISDSILNKPGRLTAEEFEIVKTHTTEGRKILQSALQGIEGSGYLSEAMDMAECHHERWDGSGYPAGLKGGEIPLGARIMAIADVFDALMAKRSYKEPYSFEDSVKIISEEAGTHFDPVVVDAFLCALPEIGVEAKKDGCQMAGGSRAGK